MKFVMLSDLHLLWDNPKCRKDNLVKVQWDKLAFIYDLALTEGADILMAGDVTDGPRSWQTLPLLANFLREQKVSTCVVRGQHDLYMRNTEQTERTMLGVLEKAGLLRVLRSMPLIYPHDSPIAVYGCSHGEQVPTPQSDEFFNILVIHADITDQSLWEGQSRTDAAKFLKEQSSYDFILTGDIHRAFAIGEGQLRNRRWIVNTGPILRKDADVYNFEHEPHVYVFDTDEVKLEKVFVPCEPAESVLSREHIDRAERVKQKVAHMDDFVAGIEAVRKGERKQSMLRENLSELLRAGNPKQRVTDVLRKVTGWRLTASSKQRRLKSD